MSLNKAVEHGKEHRTPYTGAKAIDKSCRNHGSCKWCEENRLHKRRKVEAEMAYRLKEYHWNNEDDDDTETD